MPININVDEYSSSVEVTSDSDEVVSVEIDNVEDPINVDINTGFVAHVHTINDITNFENETKEIIRDMTHVHVQSSSSDSWTIEHNLGYFPNITIVDSAGTNVVGDYQHVDVNTIIATFTYPFAGKAYLS